MELILDYVIEMLDIWKRFPGVEANGGITLQVKEGDIHAILGENGAGKTTLMSILFGLYHADKGSIRVRGKEVDIKSPNDAFSLGIGMVHQHFQLVHNFTVAENIILGKEGGFVYDIKKASRKIKDISERYGLSIDPGMVIEDITVGMQQRVEILKMLYRDADILIFDEPTAVLTPQEIDELMQIMRNLSAEGKSIILITHKLEEIKEVANHCTIIRRGKLIDVVDVKNTSVESMAAAMVGRPVSFKVDKQPCKSGPPILEVENLCVLNNKKVMAVNNFSLNVNGGEIVGIAGVDGNGQSELVEAITGLKNIESGHIRFKGRDITTLSIADRNEMGLGHIPEDRQKRGLILSEPLSSNMVIKKFTEKPFSNHGLLDYQEIRDYSERIIKEFDVRSGEGVDSLAGKLSGGNQQKAIIGREITSDPDLLIAVQPTRGLDVGAIEYIHKQLIDERDRGKAILLVSFELDEIFNLSDRIAVISGGKLIDIVNTSETDEQTIGLMMAGIKKEGNDEKESLYE